MLLVGPQMLVFNVFESLKFRVLKFTNKKLILELINSVGPFDKLTDFINILLKEFKGAVFFTYYLCNKH